MLFKNRLWIKSFTIEELKTGGWRNKKRRREKGSDSGGEK